MTTHDLDDQIQGSCQLFNKKQQELVDIELVSLIQKFLNDNSNNTNEKTFGGFKTLLQNYKKQDGDASVFQAILNALILMMNGHIDMANQRTVQFLEMLNVRVEPNRDAHDLVVLSMSSEIERAIETKNANLTSLNGNDLANALTTAANAVGVHHPVTTPPENSDLNSFVATHIADIANGSAKRAIELINNHMNRTSKRFKLPSVWTTEQINELTKELEEFKDHLNAPATLGTAQQNSMDAYEEQTPTAMGSSYHNAFRYTPY